MKVTDVTRSNNAANYVAPLHTDLVLPIIDADQKSLVHVRAKPPGTSTMDMVAPQVTLGLEVSSPAFSMCGWLWKVSESILSNAWKRRWFILHDDQLIYYNSELGLEASKNVINCRDVVSLKEDSYKGRHAWKITFAVNGVESFWMLDFDENESKSIKEMWLRKLRRCCPALQEGGPARSPLKSTPSAQDVKTRIPVSRRVSIFK